MNEWNDYFMSSFFFHILFSFCSFSVAFIYSGYRLVMVRLWSGNRPDIVRTLFGNRPKSSIIDSCPSPTDSLISLSYSMPDFRANSFGLFWFYITYKRKCEMVIDINRHDGSIDRATSFNSLGCEFNHHQGQNFFFNIYIHV